MVAIWLGGQSLYTIVTVPDCLEIHQYVCVWGGLFMCACVVYVSVCVWYVCVTCVCVIKYMCVHLCVYLSVSMSMCLHAHVSHSL